MAAAFAGVAGLVALLALGFGMNPKEVPSPLIGKPAPDFRLERLDGSGALALADLRGAPLVLNFWASWCLECQRESKVLEAFHQAGRAGLHKARVVGVAIQDTPEKAAAFAKRFGKTYPLALDGPEGQANMDYGLYGVPETYLLDAEGVVLAKHVGGVTDELLAGWLDLAAGGANKDGG